MYIHMYIHTHIYTHTFIRTHIYTHTYIHIYTHIYTHTHTHTHNSVTCEIGASLSCRTLAPTDCAIAASRNGSRPTLAWCQYLKRDKVMRNGSRLAFGQYPKARSPSNLPEGFYTICPRGNPR